MGDNQRNRKIPHLTAAMEFESACMIDKDGSGPKSLEEAANEGVDLTNPTIPPFEQRVDPETGHVTYHKKQDYDSSQEPNE